MKKSLLALAVLGAFAGAASAQSSVTLFGVVDVNAQYLNNGGGTQYGLGTDGISSSRLGFRGTEDLGGGLTASFWLEGALDPSTGSTGGQTWQRRSTVSLANQWGELRLGRDYTSTFWNETIFDPFGTNGVGSAGNLIFIFGACAGAANPANCLNLPGGSTISGYGTGLRASNMIGYFLPSGIAGGLYGQVQVAAGENAPGNKYFGGRLGYAAGPFNIAGSYGKTQVTTGGAPPAIPADQDGTVYNFGASWNFGFMQVMGFYGRTEIQNGDQNNWFIGAQAPLGVWTFKASYGQVDRSGSVFGASIEGQKANQFAIGAVYDLSKRTALYGTWAGINNKDGGRWIVGGLNNVNLGGSTPNDNSQGLQLGVKHSF